MLNVIMLCVTMLNVVMLSVVLLSVVAPFGIAEILYKVLSRSQGCPDFFPGGIFTKKIWSDL
jgi:hypothetical protein